METVFTDPQQQLVVRLSSESLSYTPAGGRGWQCRPADIAWTTSTLNTHGVEAIHLHAPDGRPVVSIPEFEQIGRFYVALLRELLRRPVFDAVRAELPVSVSLQERVLRLAGQIPAAEGPWEALLAQKQAIAVVTGTALWLSPAGTDEVIRLPWDELMDIRFRPHTPTWHHPVMRFYRSESWSDLPVAESPDALLSLCRSHLTRAREGGIPPPLPAPALQTADPDLALEYSWELEQALADGLLHSEETVYACAAGLGRGDWHEPNAVVAEPGVLDSVLDALDADQALDEVPLRTALFLTGGRLLLVERDVSGELLRTHETPLERMPRLRRKGPVLIAGHFRLRADSYGMVDPVADFLGRYRQLLAERMNPFSVTDGGEETEAERLARRERLRLHGFLTEEELAMG